MIDGLDGFQLVPDPSAAGRLRMVAVALGLSTAIVVALFATFAITRGEQIWWLAVAIYLFLSIPADVALWRVMRPPVLKADGTTVSYKSGFRTHTIALADLGVVYLGTFAPGGRLSTGIKSYVFAASGGKIAFSIPATWFRAEDMRAFAERLSVPVRGDFSQRVTTAVPIG